MNPDLLDRQSDIGYSISYVNKAVSEYFNVTVEMLEGRKRTERIAGIRFVAYALARQQGHTFQSIADAFKRDHGTIMHGCTQIRQTMKHPKVSAALYYLTNQLQKTSGEG